MIESRSEFLYKNVSFQSLEWFKDFQVRFIIANLKYNFDLFIQYNPTMQEAYLSSWWHVELGFIFDEISSCIACVVTNEVLPCLNLWHLHSMFASL